MAFAVGREQNMGYFPWMRWEWDLNTLFAYGLAGSRYSLAGWAGTVVTSHPPCASQPANEIMFISKSSFELYESLRLSVCFLPHPAETYIRFSPSGKMNSNNFLCKRRKRKSDHFPEATEFLRYPFHGVYYTLSSRPLTVETKFPAWQQMECRCIFISLFALIEPLNRILLLSP